MIDVMKEEAEKKNGDRKEEEEAAASDKSKWMSTAQLWTGDSARDDMEPEVGFLVNGYLGCDLRLSNG